MLARLSIRDIVLIDRLDIEFASGLSVLTGETGAGKSILLDSFALALGARGDSGLVRQGAEQGQVTAAFDVPEDHPARAILNANDIPAEDDLILRRVQLADGRTRAFLNDQPVAVPVLRSVGSALVEIHGQHDDRALVDDATHRRPLDAHGGLETEAAEPAQAPGFIEPAVKALDAALTALDEASHHIDRALATAAFDPHVLERIEERLIALRAAGRKYNAPVDQLAALSARYAADLALLDAGTARLAGLEQEAAVAIERYAKAAASLSGHRCDVAETLDEAVNGELKPLKLDQAQFSTVIKTAPDSPGPDGIDRVEFWVRTNPGTQPGPLMQVASGG